VRPADRDGIAGLYIPEPFANALTVGLMPRFKLTASDDGIIGFEAEVDVGFKGFRISFDVNGGGIVLDIDLHISGSGYVDFQLFKGIRLPIGWATPLGIPAPSLSTF
jgi:hypothetical protein